MNDAASPRVPAGFRPAEFGRGFIAANGPLWLKQAGGIAMLGLLVEPRHANPAGVCHGGMLMALADMQIGMGVRVQAGVDAFLPTVNMSVDFLAPAPEGTWIQGRTEVHKVTRNFAFASCLLESEAGEPILRANGMVKIPSADSAWRLRPES